MSYKYLHWEDMFNGLTWEETFKRWNMGDIPKLPYEIKKPFIWKTSAITKDKKSFFRQEFMEDKRLKGVKQNYKSFSSKPLELGSKKHMNKESISTINLSKDAVMVIPTIRKGKDFTNLYFFMKNADEKQQKSLWKHVVKESNKLLKKFDRLWINSPNLAVHYLHIRIDTKPKYYEKSELQNFLSNERVINLYSNYLKNKNNLTLQGGSRKKRILRKTKNTQKVNKNTTFDKHKVNKKLKSWCKNLKPKNKNLSHCSIVKLGNNPECTCDDGDGYFVNVKNEVKTRFGPNSINKKGEILVSKVDLNYNK